MKKRVLLVDDVPSVVRAIQRRISDEFDVELAYSGAAALETMEIASFDVVMTDLDMPKMTGWELIERASGRWPETAFVVLTGNIALREQEEKYRTAISGLLRKPCTVDTIKKAIRKACGMASDDNSTSETLTA